MSSGEPGEYGGQRLTEFQKRMNHVESEKRRRQNIRLAFEMLAAEIEDPSLNSELAILQQTTAYIQDILKRHEQMKAEISQALDTLGVPRP